MYEELNMELTDEHNMIKEEAHKFAKEVLRPAGLELDKIYDPKEMIKSPVLWETLKKAYELKYHTVLLPDSLGGAGVDPLGAHIIFEELGWGSVDLAISISVSSLPAFGILMVPTDRLLEEVLFPFCNDKDASIIGCWAITEPDHGSDTLCPYTPQFHNSEIKGQCKATLDGDEWVINGQKSAWVSNGTIATHALLFVNIDPAQGMAGGGICIVPLSSAGVSKGAPLNKMGQRALNQGEIFFDNVRIPEEYMLVGPDAYEGMVDIVLATANAAMGAFFTGLARAAYEEALEYSKQRVQGGKILFEHELIKHKLFEMFMNIEAARAISRSAMVYNYTNIPPKVEYSIASKVFCTNVAYKVTSNALQIFGGYGLAKEYPIEKFFRDARAGLIEDGSNDSLMLTGAHHL